jgi:hypothetical protein
LFYHCKQIEETESRNNLIVQRRRRPEQKGRLFIALEAVMKKEEIVISYE